MKTSPISLMKLLAVVCILQFSHAAFAQDETPTNDTGLDRLILKSGGELFGTILKESKEEDGKTYIVFKTESGSTLKFDRNRIVTKRGIISDDLMVEYHKRAEAANDPITHRMVINWCKEQPRGSAFYRDEIRYHWRQILKEDPNDDDAWRALNFERPDGLNWINEEERAAASGYVKVKTTYVPKQLVITTVELEKRKQAQNQANMAVADWKDLFKKYDANSSVVQRALLQITNESTIGKLFEIARDKNTSSKVRRLIVEAIGNVPTDLAAQQLIYFAIHGENLDLQQKASDLLKQSHYSPENIVAHVVRGGTLSSESRDIINATGRLLAEIGSDDAIIPLTTSLQTKHKVSTGKRPGGMTAGSVDGQVQGLDTGGPATVDQMFNNPLIANALSSITGQRFGFDRVSWVNWYIDNHGYSDMDVRRDE